MELDVGPHPLQLPVGAGAVHRVNSSSATRLHIVTCGPSSAKTSLALISVGPKRPLPPFEMSPHRSLFPFARLAGRLRYPRSAQAGARKRVRPSTTGGSEQ